MLPKVTFNVAKSDCCRMLARCGCVGFCVRDEVNTQNELHHQQRCVGCSVFAVFALKKVELIKPMLLSVSQERID